MPPLQKALSEAWRAGFLCLDDKSVQKLGFDLSQMAALIPGLPKGTTLGFQLGVGEAPQFSSDDKGNFRMSVKNGELDLTLKAPNAEASHIILSTDLAIGVTAQVDNSTGGYIQASLTDLKIERSMALFDQLED